MKPWWDFFERFKPNKQAPQPGSILINFVNRYLEPMDGIRYKIYFDSEHLTGKTTEKQNTVLIQPKTLSDVKIYAWAHRLGEYKLIDTCKPVIGQCQMRNERMKTFRQDSQTRPHPRRNPISPLSSPPPVPPPVPGPTPTTPQGVDSSHRRTADGSPEHQTHRPIPGDITLLQLKRIFPDAADSYLSQVASELNSNLPKYKLDTPLRRAHFFAQVRQEAGSRLSPKSENLNYLPHVLIEKFSYYGQHQAEAREDGRLEEIQELEIKKKGKLQTIKKKVIVHRANQELIANKVYSNRMGNGAMASGDGWRYRGRGIFQLTGRNNYSQFSTEYAAYWEGSMDFISNPDKVVEFPYYIRSAVWYWLKNSIYAIADEGSGNSTINKVTRAINGSAMDAASERREYFREITYPTFQ